MEIQLRLFGRSLPAAIDQELCRNSKLKLISSSHILPFAKPVDCLSTVHRQFADELFKLEQGKPADRQSIHLFVSQYKTPIDLDMCEVDKLLEYKPRPLLWFVGLVQGQNRVTSLSENAQPFVNSDVDGSVKELENLIECCLWNLISVAYAHQLFFRKLDLAESCVKMSMWGLYCNAMMDRIVAVCPDIFICPWRYLFIDTTSDRFGHFISERMGGEAEIWPAHNPDIEEVDESSKGQVRAIILTNVLFSLATKKAKTIVSRLDYCDRDHTLIVAVETGKERCYRNEILTQSFVQVCT